MTPERYQQIKQVYLEALELEGPARDAYLKSACGDDDALRREVEALLADNEAATDFLESPALAKALKLGSMPEPEQIGPYRIIRKVGEGGMGVVYEAEQTEPIRRRVALKLTKYGMDPKSLIARFETERQALALMNHANIARVLDAGATEQGRPYFVMEYVQGVPITEHCDKQRLSIEERLKLFMQVCEAVQHAHQKGIIHRDLSARNVLIEFADEQATVKVIDFGIAKATDRRLTEQTLFTEHGRPIGTPEYMSPEQTDPANQDIDTRTDVYSLGVLLYELLSGKLPFDSSELRKKQDAEIQRIIREDDPPKPSTRVSSLSAKDAASGTDVARSRRTDARSLVRRMRGDLDWIVMKCMEKERARRYETAASLGEDIRRHLHHEPVTAGPPSAGYRVTKFVRRNRGLVASVTVVIAVLVLGMTVAVAERRAAEASEQKARVSLDSLKSALMSVNPDISGEADRTLLWGILEDVSSRVDYDFENQSGVAAELKGTIGAVYALLGKYDQGVTMMEGALDTLTQSNGERDPVVVRIQIDLGVAHMEHAEYEKAERLFRKSLDACGSRKESENALAAECIYNLGENLQRSRKYEQARPLYQQALEMRRRVLGKDHPQVAECMIGLGVVCYHGHDLAEAERFFREAYEIAEDKLPPTHSTVLASCNNLAIVLGDQKRHTEALTIHNRNLQAARRVWGEDHPTVAWMLNNLAMQHMYQGRLKLAEREIREAIDIRRRKLSETHPDTITALSNLAHVLLTAKRYDEAVEPLQTCLAQYRKTRDMDDPFVVKMMGNLTLSLRESGLLDEAETMGRECLERSRRVFKNSPRTRLIHTDHLAWTLLAKKVDDECITLFREGIALRKSVGENHTWTQANAHYYLALVLCRQGKTEEADSCFEEALRILDVIDGKRSDVSVVSQRRGECQLSANHHAGAEQSLLDAYRHLDADAEPDGRVEVVQLLVDLYDAWHAAEPGHGYDGKAAEWRAKLQSPAANEPGPATQPAADLAREAG